VAASNCHCNAIPKKAQEAAAGAEINVILTAVPWGIISGTKLEAQKYH